MNYAKTAISGISWSVALRWTLRGFTFVRLAILARILLPAQFGTFSVATIVLGFVEIITETWINVFLVQEKGEIDKYVDTAWIISILRGFFIGLIIYFSSGPVSSFFHSPASEPIIKLMALVPVIRGFINPSIAKLQKNLWFQSEYWIRSILFLIEAIIAVSLSYLLHNVVGLVWGMIASAGLEVVLSLIIFHPRPRLLWSKPIAKQIFSQGVWVTSAGIFNYIYQHGDDIVVGRLLGETGLGLYDPIYKISGLPVSEVSDVVAKVTFPIFVNLRDSNSRLKTAFLKTTAITTTATTVVGLGIFALAPQIILLVLGPNWLVAISALRVLCLYGISRAVISSLYPLFLATKHQEYVTWVTLTSLIGMGLTIIPAVKAFGLVGAGLSATLGSLLAVPLAVVFVRKILK